VFLSERWERKYSIVGVSLAIALFGLLYGYSFTPVAIVIFGFLAATMMDTFSALAFSYTPEQFPTDVRNSGTGLAYGVGRLANVINPFIVSAIFASFGYQAVFAYIAGAWVITALIALAFGMKTTGLSLETISDEPADAAGLALPRASEAAR
jgi:putative MFS transporter